MSIHSQLEMLKEDIAGMGSALVAFSGGVDSTFLLKVAHDVLRDKALAVTVRSPSYPKKELNKAIAFTKEQGINHILIDSDETDQEEFKANTPDRCYHCKKSLFSRLKGIAKKHKIDHVMDASNLDDASDYRPGMRAKTELSIISPLIDAKLTKDNIRNLSRELGLDTWNKPALACLASRFPYGTKISDKRLKTVEKAEDFIQSLGITQLRVRFHETIARIEVSPTNFSAIIENREQIDQHLRSLGFNYTTLDIKGYRTGSLNEVI